MATIGQLQGLISILIGVVTAPLGSGIVSLTAENNKYGYERCALWWRAAVLWTAIIYVSILFVILILGEDLLSIIIFKDNKFSWLIIVIFIGLPLSSFGILLGSILNGLKEYKSYILIGLISIISSSLATAILTVKLNLFGALLGFAIFSSIAGSISILFLVRKPWFRFSLFFGRVDVNKIKDIGGYLLIAIISSVCIPFSLIMVRNGLINQVGWDEAGQWQSVYRISETYLMVITTSLGLYYLPRLSEKNNKFDILTEVKKTLYFVIPISVLLAFTIYLSRYHIISIIFNGSFEKSSELYAVQLIGDIIKIFGWVYAYVLISKRKIIAIITSEILFSIIFILSSNQLISIYGTQGANIAYTFSYVCYSLYIYIYALNFLKKLKV